MAVILYLVSFIGLFSILEKLGQSDLNKKIMQFCKKTYFKLLLINHQVDFKDI